MTAALVTLVFLATLWMLIVVGAAVLEQSGGKILAALKGRSMTTVATRPVRMRVERYRPGRAVRASARLRAAA
jgi:hypothetical protein